MIANALAHATVAILLLTALAGYLFIGFGLWEWRQGKIKEADKAGAFTILVLTGVASMFFLVAANAISKSAGI